MLSMVLITEEGRNNLSGVRASTGRDREARVSPGGIGFREDHAPGSPVGNSVGVVRASSAKREEAAYDYKELVTSGNCSAWMHGFETGDMVWGKVKSHPWWPGHIFAEAFASPSVLRMKKERHVLVAFFGDSSYGWFDPAELLPFDLHFAEKCRQTNLRTFLKAVEEAVDEVGRRRALAVSCRCRQPNSFRPTSVSGYVNVDVTGYESNLTYSIREIKRSRDAFVPADAISSIRLLALGPCDIKHGSLGLIKSTATILALRRALFEEFDETYAQAFGVEPVRPSRDAQGLNEQQQHIAPRAAPLSGPLVVAEELGKKGGPSKARAEKSSQKDKYLFKRRDDATASGHASVPASPAVAPTGVAEVRYIDFTQATSSQDEANAPATASPAPTAVDAYVLQKRASPDADPTSEKPHGASSEEIGVKSPEIAEDGGKIDTPSVIAIDLDHKADTTERDAIAAARSAEQVRGDGDKIVAEGGLDEMKKKKRKRIVAEGEPGVVLPVQTQARFSENLEIRRKLAAGKSSPPAMAQPVDRSTGGYYFLSLPKIELSAKDVDFPMLVTDLLALSLDPFHGVERNASLLVRHVFLRFRSIVYQKSLVHVPVPTDSSAVIEKEAPEQQEPPSAPKPVRKDVVGVEDLSKPVRKRPPSDRQEEMTTKREKKLKQLKAMASEKKAVVSQKHLPSDHTKTVVQKDTSGVKKIPKVEKKPEPPVPAKVPSPTYLFMKFPPGTTLPSISSQKVKFGRFGQLDMSGFRVYWNTHTCKILFRFKADAQNAFAYAKSNDMFGQIKVSYSLKDAEAPAPDPMEAEKQAVENRADDLQPTGNDPRLSLLRPSQQQQAGQLKSCLKKPPSEEAGSSGIGSVKESPRVKFALTAEESRHPSVVVNGGGGNRDERREAPSMGSAGNGNGKGEHSLSKDVDAIETPIPITRPLDTNIDFPRSVNPLRSSLRPPHPSNVLARTQAPTPSAPTLRHQLPTSLPQNLPPPPPPPPQQQQQRPQPIGLAHDRPAPQFGRVKLYQSQTVEDRVDISTPMLNLLMICNDIVQNVSSALGYTIYHPI